MKTPSQKQFELSLQRSRGLAHPAKPTESATGWHITCERTDCSVSFFTPTRQRRYCSDHCRRLVEQERKARSERLEQLLLQTCSAADCAERFRASSAEHRFCSSACRKRAHRVASDLSSTICGWCKQLLPEDATRRRVYCDDACRRRAFRSRAC